jgi:beta-phosphoglucomutase
MLAQHRCLAEGDALIKAVLFDFNGVLIDDEAQHCESMQRVLADEGIPLTREQYYAQYLGLDDRTGFAEAYRRGNRTLTTELMEHLVERKSQIYLQLASSSLRMVPGAPQFVLEAAKRYRLGIVSGALRREIDHVLGQTGLADRFEVVVSSDDAPRSKPDPAPYLAAHQALNRTTPIEPRECVVIEDSLHGLASARAAGMPCIMLATSHPAPKLEGRGAARVWGSLAGHSVGELDAL